jgi:acyl-CoA synthetase (AMP-forming)/AMP-acid ligase II/acyl carrier protein
VTQFLDPAPATGRAQVWQSIYHLLQAGAGRAPGAPAILAPGRPPLSYGQLFAHVVETAGTLRAMGIGRDDRVAIVLPNGAEMATAFLSVAAATTSAPLNPAYGAREFEFYLSDLDARAVIVDAAIDSPARSVARARGIPVIELSPLPEAAAGIFALAGKGEVIAARGGFAQPGDVALVLHTSGTTSRPKIVPLTQANLCVSAGNIRSAFELAPGDRCLNVMPLFHIHGLVAAVLSTLLSGGSVVCTPGFDASEFFQWLPDFRPTWYTAVPTMHQAILHHAGAHRDVIAGCPLRFIRSCSAPLPPPVMAELERVFGAPAVESYGMTEAAHQMTSNPLPPRPRKPGSVGLPTGPEVAVMDQAGNLLPAGQVGEVVIRGANVTLGYENNPEANASAFARGWFRTGDQGLLDGDGYLFLSGRSKEIINRGGEKVAPREIDDVLLRHPAIQQAVAFAVPHPTLGEDVAVAVVLRQGMTVTRREIRDFAFAHLADFKVPSQVVLVDEVPKGPTGKLQRLGLAGILAPRLEAEFVAPMHPLEATLARIWAAVLGVQRVGIHDNFFALGGDSLRATQVVARVRATFGVELPLQAAFREPTIAGLAPLVEELVLEAVEALTEEEARRQLP